MPHKIFSLVDRLSTCTRWSTREDLKGGEKVPGMRQLAYGAPSARWLVGHVVGPAHDPAGLTKGNGKGMKLHACPFGRRNARVRGSTLISLVGYREKEIVYLNFCCFTIGWFSDALARRPQWVWGIWHWVHDVWQHECELCEASNPHWMVIWDYVDSSGLILIMRTSCWTRERYIRSI